MIGCVALAYQTVIMFERAATDRRELSEANRGQKDELSEANRGRKDELSEAKSLLAIPHVSSKFYYL